MKRFNNSTIQQFNKKVLMMLPMLVIFTINIASSQNNILKVIGGDVTTNDSIEIRIDIENDQDFISFQCDILLPPSMQYIESSAALTERASDHVLSASILQGNRLRLFAYSLNNKKFIGDSGTVAVFSINSGVLEGIYEIIVQNPIIGDNLSNNIITDSVNGTVNVTPDGIFERNSYHSLEFNFSPNPFINSFNLHIDLKEPAELNMELLSIDGRMISNKNLGYFTRGEHMINSENFIKKNIENSQPMLFRVYAITKNNKFFNGIKKIIKLKY